MTTTTNAYRHITATAFNDCGVTLAQANGINHDAATEALAAKLEAEGLTGKWAKTGYGGVPKSILDIIG